MVIWSSLAPAQRPYVPRSYTNACLAKTKRALNPDGTTAPRAYGGTYFQGLTETESRLLSDSGESAEHAPMHWLYQQGDSFTNLYLVQSGLVRLTQVMPEGDEVLVRLVGPGEVFGYSSLVLNCPSNTSAQTVQRTQLMVWERMRALDLIESIPRTTFNLFKIAVRDVAYFNERARLLQTQSVSQRVKWAIAEVARKAGTKDREAVVIGDGVGQREIADLAGTTIFTVSRELSRLQREGILRKERRRIFVLQVGKLYR